MRVRSQIPCAAILALVLSACSSAKAPPYSVIEKPMAEMAADLAAGRVTAEAVVKSYLARIATIDPQMHAIIALNPHAIDEARASDARRAAGKSRGPLDGVPILLKDNIDVADGIPTTAGSLALVRNVPVRNARLASRVLNAGAIILGKTNLSEWANIRSRASSSGWSAVGGLTRNPYALDRSACGSSSGSAVAATASFAAASVGTETDGSITCPAAINGLVGLKPTVGLISRTGIVPISRSQDTAGPLARSVTDAAMLLTALAGTDPADRATEDSDNHRTDYAKELDANALKGARIGVMRFIHGYSPPTQAVFEAAMAAMRNQGAVLVDISTFEFGDIGRNEHIILMTELKAGLNEYLAQTPRSVGTRTLADLIAFDRAETREMAWFGQDEFEEAEVTGGLADPAYIDAQDRAHRRAGINGIDRLLRENDVVALVAPTTDFAWIVDLAKGDSGAASAARLPAVAGYPHLTVPMGEASGLPIGLSFIGPAWSEQRLLSLGYAFEQATHARRRPTFPPKVQDP